MYGSANRYTRPDAAKLYVSIDKVNKSGSNIGSITEVTLTAGDWGTFPNPSYVNETGGETIVCSGLPHNFGDRVGIVLEDTITATVGAIACAGRFFVKITTGRTPAVNDIAYFDVSAETFSDNLAAMGAGDIQCGYFVSAAETLAGGNTKKLPAGDWAIVELTPYQTVL